MKLKFYQTTVINPYRNLAVERYFVDHIDGDEYIIYFWKNKDTIVIGRNQYAYDQFSASAVERDGIKIARRRSGGGAVYHDENNLNFSFIMNTAVFDKNSGYDIIMTALKSIGIPVEKSGRNDLTADGRKFSGNAFLTKGNIYCHHGTILIKTDTERMEEYLNVPKEKLENKGVKSVKSRVVNLTELDGEISAEGIMHAVWVAAESYFGESASIINEDYFDTSEIDAEEKAFGDATYLFGERLSGYQKAAARIDGIGGIEAFFKRDGDTVTEIKIFTDSMTVEDTAAAERVIKGKSLEELKGIAEEGGFLGSVAGILKLKVES
ncbi:MAG: lipoate--protein ligase [Clostridiales bacterium]|jgi:lipoate-protein ligase A|nr:lipoate--protein ligase [Clostridiales bacterium]